MAERCERCHGYVGAGEILWIEKGDCSPRICYCIEAQAEALESAAERIENVVGLQGDSSWNKALLHAARIVKSHRPWEKPKAPRPRVSRRAVEKALRDAVRGERTWLNGALEELSTVLDLVDDER